MSYGIYIGKNHTSDGHAWLAGYGDEPSSHWLEIVPRQTYATGATITVGMTPEADLPGRLTEIPQVRETARHLRVSYSYYLGVPAPLTNGGLNEYGIAAYKSVDGFAQAEVDYVTAIGGIDIRHGRKLGKHFKIELFNLRSVERDARDLAVLVLGELAASGFNRLHGL